MNQPDKVKELLANSELNVNEAAGKGRTALYAVCCVRSLEALQVLLLDQRVDVNKMKEFGLTALYIASSENHADIVQILLKDPRIEANKAKEEGDSPIHCLRGRFCQCRRDSAERFQGRGEQCDRRRRDSAVHCMRTRSCGCGSLVGR